MKDDGSAAKVTVDGTDFPTLEYLPFNSARKSHKFDGPGLRYEVVLCIKTGWIVSINGPFLCGSWPDLRIARSKLHMMLSHGEYYLADLGYRAAYTPVITKNDVSPTDKLRMNWLMARHEQVNRRFKAWGILGNVFNFEEKKHKPVFYAIASITQIEIMSGCFDWGQNTAIN